MKIYFSAIGGSEVQASITSCSSREEVQAQLDEAGGGERVIHFISIESEAMDALCAIAAVNIEHEGSIGREIERLIARVFSDGMSSGLRASALMR
ncbi:MAG: hypothetical protein KBC81_00275 [Candidatus Pacebacteria bacterium]|nr:hypothetical protein [Candidatus Paceibacterota bacterium]